MNLSIIHAIHSIDPAHGGTTEAVRLLVGPHSQVESRVVSADDPANDWWSDWPCPVHKAGPASTKFGWSPGWERELHAHVKPGSVVVIHGLWQYHVIAAFRHARRANVPVLVFPHGMLDPWALRQSRWKKRLAWWAFNRRVLRNSACVCFTTEEERSLATTVLGESRGRLEIVPLGVDDPPDTVAQLRFEFDSAHPDLADRRVFLFLGRLHPKKGCDMLLEAYARWKEDGPDAPMHLRFAGPAHHPAYQAELERLCGSLGLHIGREVSFAGMVEGRDKWRALAKAEALLLPSHQENFGIVVAEALACGVPVLLSDKVNTSALVHEFGAGIVAEDTIEGTLKLLQQWGGWPAAQQSHARDQARSLHFKHFSRRPAQERFFRVVEQVAQEYDKKNRI